jgi:hypothetical protein
MKHVFLVVFLAFLSTSAAAEDRCGPLRLDPAQYAAVKSHAELGELVARDVTRYGTSLGVLRPLCFAHHFAALGEGWPFGTKLSIDLGVDEPGRQTYNLTLTIRKTPSAADDLPYARYWARLSAADGALEVLWGKERTARTVSSIAVFRPESCGPSLFEPSRFAFVIDKRKAERLIEEAIGEYLAEYGEIDWLCFSDDFAAMNHVLPERVWVHLIPGGTGPAGTYRFTVRNTNLFTLLSVAPGGSNGEFTAIVRVEGPDRIAIIERGGRDRWLELDKGR